MNAAADKGIDIVPLSALVGNALMTRKIDIEALPYRPCVGIALFNRAGRVWVGSRSDKDAEGEGEGHWWQMPQGGIDEDEDPYKAALRELYEETSVKNVEPDPRGDRLVRLRPAGRPRRPVVGRALPRPEAEVVRAPLRPATDSEIDVLHPGGGKFKSGVFRVALGEARRACPR